MALKHHHLLRKTLTFRKLNYRFISTSQLEETFSFTESNPLKIPNLSFPETQITTLPNGLRVATESDPSAKTATISAWVDVGSRHDTDETSGIAQHMKLNRGFNMSMKERQEMIENMGGCLTACTAKEYTVYNLKVIAAAGAVKHEDIVEKVNKLITRLPTDPTTASQLAAKEPTTFTASEVRIVDDSLPLAHFAVAFKGASLTDPDSIALMVMQFMLGSWNKSTDVGKFTGSELSQRVSIDNIAERLMPFNKNYKDAGLFGVYACAKPDRLDDLAYAIMYEISKLSYRVSEADVIRSCNQLKSSILLDLDGTTPVAEAIGSQLLAFGRRISFAELFARIDAVDASTIKCVARRFLLDRDIAIAAMGPIQGLPECNWFRRSTCMIHPPASG